MDTLLHPLFLDIKVNTKLSTNVSNLLSAQAEDFYVPTFRPELPPPFSRKKILEKTKAILVETSILFKSSAASKGESKQRYRWARNRKTQQNIN